MSTWPMLLGEALGAKVELVPVEAPNRVPALVSDKVDVLIACLTPTDERARTINFYDSVCFSGFGSYGTGQQ